MVRYKGVTRDAEPHTLAKHAILARYLDAWFPILAHSAAVHKSGRPEVLYIDAFAGPGRYSKGEDGSPIIAIKRAMRRQQLRAPVRLLFVESDEPTHAHLTAVIEELRPQWSASPSIASVQARHGECEAELSAELDAAERAGVAFGPALAFLDQFGFSDVPINLVRRVLSFSACEAFIYLNFRNINRFITDPSKAGGLDRTFGDSTWRAAIGKPELDQVRIIRHAYEQALEHNAHARHVQSFTMYAESKRPLSYLFFATNHLRGLEEMKKSMWSVDGKGTFRFGDGDDPSQMDLLTTAYDQRFLAERLARDLVGKTLSGDELWAFVLTKTQCWQFKKALSILELSTPPRIRVDNGPPGRRAGTYPGEPTDESFRRLRFTFVQGSLF
jgi:three-Cys-motif partner protein